MQRKFRYVTIIIIFISSNYLVTSFTPLTKEEHIEKIAKLNDNIEPFRRNISECSRQVKASMADVENFLKRIPQQTMQGKCLVACILKRNSIIEKNKISKENLLNAHEVVYGQDSEVMSRLNMAINECSVVVEDIFEVCEYASVFNDCMHVKMEHIFDKIALDRRMEALEQLSRNRDEWTDEEDEMLQLMKDEL